jgi:DNA gyrase subunit A
MHDLGLSPAKPHKKCARVVGEVLGKYHPHGDGAVYDALVRLAQPFAMREPLVAGHGNFGSLDDDPAAAMRYTECRLQALAAEALLADLGPDTVDWAPNFDTSQTEPTVLPSRLPMLLINGSSGIAVGIATKIAPHNMREVVAGLKALVADPDISSRDLMRHIPAPDFPTGGEILLDAGVSEAYERGSGGVILRGKAVIEGGGGAGTAGPAAKSQIVITEMPYQVSKARAPFGSLTPAL